MSHENSQSNEKRNTVFSQLELIIQNFNPDDPNSDIEEFNKLITNLNDINTQGPSKNVCIFSFYVILQFQFNFCLF